MLRVAFLIESETSAAARYRVLSNVEAFEREGVDAYPMMLARTARGRRKLFEDVSGFDVVILQRRLLQPWETTRLRRSVRVLGYDFDDAMLFRDGGRGGHRSLSRRVKFRSIIKAADFVTAGNEYLSGLAAPWAADRHVVPTPVDVELFRPRERENGPLRLGWIGSASTVGYLDGVMGAVEEAHREHPEMEFVVVSDRFPPDSPPFLKKVEWKAESEAEETARFDIGIMPLPDNAWTRGKCGFKLLLYGASGVAAIASPVGVNREIIEEGQTGLLATTKDEWRDAILRLAADGEKRRRMGAAARERTVERYSREAVVGAWARIIREAAGVSAARGNVS
jgi:glycosyltransferase involved in cell wall biosynthesis